MNELECWTREEPKEKGYYAITSVENPNYGSPCVAYWTGVNWECSIIFPKEEVLFKSSPRTKEEIGLLALLFRISMNMSYSMNGTPVIEDMI
jgi:hypothetical protein